MLSMRRLAGSVLAIVVCSTMTAGAWANVPARDIADSRDSPLVSRFPGSVIIGYRTGDYDQADLPMGKYGNEATKFTKTEAVSGRITDISYAVPAGKSAFEVYQNYLTALKQAGFETRFQCTDDDCGARYDASAAFADNNFMTALANHPGGGAEYQNCMIDLLLSNGGKLYLTTLHLSRPQGDVDLSLLVNGNPGQRVGVLLKIVEGKPMATGEVKVDGKAMSQGLVQHGHIALYGIQFASDSAALTPDSGDTLAQMAALLKSQPSLKVYIVGHTDNTGTLVHNLALSQQRADAVVKALAARGIAADRMGAKGLGSYAPVASNQSDAGRAQNRRVELVEQ